MDYEHTHPHFIEVPSHCSCSLPEGCRGSTGWHFRPTNYAHSKGMNMEAYERCPRFWKDDTIDPADRRLLVAKVETKKTRRVRA